MFLRCAALALTIAPLVARELPPLMGNRRLDKAVINVVFIGGWVGGLLGPVACILGAAAVEAPIGQPLPGRTGLGLVRRSPRFSGHCGGFGCRAVQLDLLTRVVTLVPRCSHVQQNVRCPTPCFLLAFLAGPGIRRRPQDPPRRHHADRPARRPAPAGRGRGRWRRCRRPDRPGTFTSANPAVAVVDGGIVRPVGDGETTITAIGGRQAGDGEGEGRPRRRSRSTGVSAITSFR